MKKLIQIMLYIVIASFLFVSCSDDDEAGPINGNGNGDDNATVQGRVTDNSGYGDGMQKISAGVEGAAVTTAEIQSDGSLSTTSESSVQTNVDGEFEIETNSAGKSDVVVVATKGSSEWKAIISSNIQAESQNYCPPLNNETTAEADVYAMVVADNKTNLVGYHDVAFHIGSELATQIRNNTTSETEVKSAIEAKAEARAKALTNSHYGYSNSQYEEAQEVDESSQENFERELYFGNDTEASYNAAWENYFNTRVSGYGNTSISTTHYAQSEEISGKAMLNFNKSLHSDTKFELEKRNAYLRAKLIAKAMLEEHEKAGSNQEHRQTVDEENDNLLIAIKNSTSIDGINQAYVNYRSAMKANVKSSFNSISTSLTVVETAVETSLKSTLEASVAAAGSIDVLISAYTTFYASVNTTVSGEVNLPSSSQVEAIANIYALIYMQV